MITDAEKLAISVLFVWGILLGLVSATILAFVGFDFKMTFLLIILASWMISFFFIAVAKWGKK